MPRRPSDRPWVAGALAVVATGMAAVALFSASRFHSMPVASQREASAERIAFIVPPQHGAERAVAADAPASRTARPETGARPTAMRPFGRADSTRSAGADVAPPSEPRAGSPGGDDGVGTTGGTPLSGIHGPRAATSITGRGAALPGHVRDSIIRGVGAGIPALARAREQTTEERDEAWRAVAAANREGRSSGRPAPIGDPTKAGAQMGGVAISFPLFSPGPSKAQRQRDSVTLAENRRIAARIQARLDSVEAARRRDSLVVLAGDDTLRRGRAPARRTRP